MQKDRGAIGPAASRGRAGAMRRAGLRGVAAALLAGGLASLPVGQERAAAPGLPITQPDLAMEAIHFAEPLAPTVETSAEEDAELLAAIAHYQAAAVDDVSAFEEFLAAHSRSGWRLTLLTNLGLAYSRYGYFSRALDAFDRAWREGEELTDPHAKPLADRALGELIRMLAGLSHNDELAALLERTSTRPLSGQVDMWRNGAKYEIWTMSHNLGIPCGLTSLRAVMSERGASPEQQAVLDAYKLGPLGMPLAEVSRLATEAQFAHRLIHRDLGERVPVPSVVHWRIRHFSAIISFRDGRYELADHTFGPPNLWVTQAALDAESDGYFLVPDDTKNADGGWRNVSLDEAKNVRGR